MELNVTQKLIEAHLVAGTMTPGEPIALRIDQTLTQDATGTMVMLELEALGLERAKTELSAQYVDHNLIQEDYKNPDDHRFLRSAARRWGIHFSRPGNGVSHPLHQECFGIPGKTLLGSDSHTPAAGAIGMLAIGAGGIDVAMAIAGEPYHLQMPEVWGVRLDGALPPWVSAKDIILEMLRRHGVDGGVGCVIEYYGPGLAALSTMDRHVIANMGTELGATSTVFPSDGEVRAFLRGQEREDDWRELVADDGATYDRDETIDLGGLEPLIAKPSSPGKVVTVREVAGAPIGQAYIGSSANPGYRDFAITAAIVDGKTVHPGVSFDVNPTSRQILQNLLHDGWIGKLIGAGARLHQAGCNGCIGMGQAPATETISLRTVPRNFPSRSGTPEDKVYLVSPETAAASALRGVITDPRDLDMEYPRIEEPAAPILVRDQMEAPLDPAAAAEVELAHGPNIVALPDFEPLPENLDVEVLLKVGDDISTDEIMPAGTRVLPYRSNIPKISDFVFDVIDKRYARRAREVDGQGHAVVGGDNYGQGSSREHAALAPRHLGLRLVVVKSFARIHRSNLVNFGILPLVFSDPAAYDAIEQGGRLRIENLYEQVRSGDRVRVEIDGGDSFAAQHGLSSHEREVLLAGGVIPWLRARTATG